MNQDPEAWQRLAARVRAARAQLGWTQAELAEHAGVSAKSVYTLESGAVPTRRPPTLHRIAHALGWPPGFIDSLLDGPAMTYRDETGETTVVYAKRAHNPAVSSLRGAMEFSRACAEMGADPRLIEQFDAAADALLESAMTARAARTGQLTQDHFAAVAHSPEHDGGTSAVSDRAIVDDAVRRFEGETDRK
ncbi:helix-turn-helix domain-containing protein [Streptomyces sp. SB3404]|uniref:Helix-turn-helix domain-containing protein n=1 Tax=Streptomyces boncukensis TaxID=2711219 RepID=A0A6G4WRM0_9ACTN|nr:helix-turn-helix domain-containing protein [Streptomyces boncukensis]